jgi:hypothetical protein
VHWPKVTFTKAIVTNAMVKRALSVIAFFIRGDFMSAKLKDVKNYQV